MASINRSDRKLRILLIQFEQIIWRAGRSYPYSLNYGIEDALRSLGAEVTVIASPWLTHLKTICAGKEFDQVWINDLPHFDDMSGVLEDAAKLASICIGFITESLEYTPDEIARSPSLEKRKDHIEHYLTLVTHVAAVDEADHARLQAELSKPVFWLPNTIPTDFINRSSLPRAEQIAFFSGVIYGDRDEWLHHPKLKETLAYQQSTNSGKVQTILFDSLPGHCLRRFTEKPSFPARLFYPAYLAAVRYLHKQGSQSWLEGMQAGAAVVNLPHYIKAYSTRVAEGMAAGRPVVSWRVPERPRNKALFVDGEEILLYETADELAAQIERILSNQTFAEQIAENARQKIKRWHTTEKRVEQILHWVESGDLPTYGISE